MIPAKVEKMGSDLRGDEETSKCLEEENKGSFLGEKALLMAHLSQKETVCNLLKALVARPAIKTCQYD